MAETVANESCQVKQMRVSQMLVVLFNTPMDMHTVRRKNLRLVIERMAGGSVAQFARLTGIGEARLAQVLSEKYREGQNFGEKAARTIEGAANLPLLSLDSTLHPHIEVPRFSRQVDNKAFDSNVTAVPPGRRAIPVISAIQAGAMREISEPYPSDYGYSTIYTDEDYSKWAFALVIEGDSMLPDFRPGDQVIIEPEWEPRPGEFVAAKNGKQEATFKKYRQRGVGSDGNAIFELVPLNDDYPTMRSDESSLTIIGVMAEHRRKSRR